MLSLPAYGSSGRRRPSATGTAALACLVALLSSCSDGRAAGPDGPATARVTPTVPVETATAAPATPATPATAAPATPATPATAAPAGTGREGSTQRRSFVPTQIRLASDGPRRSVASVIPVDTQPTGELGLPADPGVVGWWESGALAGDAFGSVVLAGHIDSRTQGLGFFVRLLTARPGDTVDLSDGRLRQSYRVVSNRSVDKLVLASGTDTFSQRVPGRLVLITCTGSYDRVQRHYTDNLVVTAEPVGTATPVA